MNRFGLALAALAVWLSPLPADAAGEIKVVASFSILADIVREVGGERVAIRTLVGPGSDAHVYQPTPADAEALKEADLVVVNGLGFEGWLPRLVEASGTKAPVVEAAARIAVSAAGGSRAEDGLGDEGHEHGAVDPHAWQDPRNVIRYNEAIASALCAVDEAGCATYGANAARASEALVELDDSVKALFAGIPAERRTIITPHEALGYFGRAYGLTILAPEGVSTEVEASAKDVAALIDQIREKRATAVFAETIKDRRLIERIAAETGAAIGGELYSDSLSPPDGPAPTYRAMILHNARTIAAALGAGG